MHAAGFQKPSPKYDLSNFKIRKAEEKDLRLLVELVRELAEFEHLLHEVKVTEEILRDSLFGATRSAEVLIGELSGEPIGMAIYFHNFSSFLGRRGLYLEDLFIRPKYRSRGYGGAMLRELARIAVERGCGRFEWWVLDWNKKAIEFYRKIGAVAMDDWTVFRLSGEKLQKFAEASL